MTFITLKLIDYDRLQASFETSSIDEVPDLVLILEAFIAKTCVSKFREKIVKKEKLKLKHLGCFDLQEE